MNSLKVKLKSIDVQAAATLFRCMTENAMHAAIKQTNRKVTNLSGGGYPTENRLSALRGISSISIYEQKDALLKTRRPLLTDILRFQPTDLETNQRAMSISLFRRFLTFPPCSVVCSLGLLFY
jgi:hypothetical protein